VSCEHRDDVGAWVLGALPEDEHERFAAHLAGCEECRGEVAELQMVADTLPLAAPQVAPPPELKERLMTAVRAEAAVLHAAGPEADVVPVAAATDRAPTERTAAGAAPAERDRTARPERRRGSGTAWWRRPRLALRPLPAAALAAVLLALGIAIGALVAGGGGSSARTVQAQVVAPSAPSARASLSLSGDDATLEVSGFPSPPSGRVYQVWVKRPGRDPAPTTALFSVRQGQATVDVPGRVRGGDRVLVTAEPDGGSEAPTRAPVIVSQPA
jgi:anti-sigma-K factor RskA/putative zinc finger protein